MLALIIVLTLLTLAACSSRTGQSSNVSAPSQSRSEPTTPFSSTDDSQIMMSESSNTGEAEQPTQILDTKLANEIMCIFGAEIKVQYDDKGQPIPSSVEEYRTSVISFYYDEDGIASSQDINPYGFYGWYLVYTMLKAEKIAEIIPGFERFVLVRNDPVSGEIYGAPGDAYEKIVTSFFDVDVQQLRGDDLYDETAHAYVPITGPGRGEQPSVRIVNVEQQDELISLDIALEGQYTESYSLQLIVREDESNEFAGIKFVSLVQK